MWCYLRLINGAFELMRLYAAMGIHDSRLCVFGVNCEAWLSPRTLQCLHSGWEGTRTGTLCLNQHPYLKVGQNPVKKSTCVCVCVLLETLILEPLSHNLPQLHYEALATNMMKRWEVTWDKKEIVKMFGGICVNMPGSQLNFTAQRVSERTHTQTRLTNLH